MNKRYYEHTLSTTREFIEYLLFNRIITALQSKIRNFAIGKKK